ncbi:peptidoglycan-binding protein [Streptomyces sp. A7024]|uniref:Peptidoglycan-binding protein n=1 Tax=Streptomyces coryli TaxID=1128680 RepID=A0A6G4U8F7_9ACTN|nr:peptidoglycan-binding protein [Streptomyces coryli]NGN68403.1 peptidoglycan-binding protein [Streptomyces coryli]
MKRKNLYRLGGLIAAVAALLFGLIQPAQSYASAFFPTQSAGDRGTDVLAIQYLLQAKGKTVPTDGVFGSSTTTAVKEVQQAAGIGVDGIVGPNTWGKLTPQIKEGATGAAVKAVQAELNAKRNAGLTVDGTFNAATTAAVKSFQSHAGIGADGVVGPTTWKNLLWHYEKADFSGSLCDVDPDGNTSASWGTSAAIAELEEAAKRFGATGKGEIPVGDISFEHGGDIGGHASHEVGLDIDLWPVRTDSQQCTGSRITWQSSAYDRAATRELVKALRAAAPGHIRYVWFNDPTLINEGLTSSYAGHDNHLHIRYCEKVHPNSLYTC